MRIIVGTLVGAIVLFVWGAVSWTVLPWHTATIRELPDEGAVMQSLVDTETPTGAYYFPAFPHIDGLDDDDEQAANEDYAARHEAGPLGMVIFNAQGHMLADPMLFARGFGLNVVTALFASMLLAAAVPSIGGYVRRVAFIAALGVMASLMSDLALWNYMFFPIDYTIVNALDHVVGAMLLGLVLAAIIKPRPAASLG